MNLPDIVYPLRGGSYNDELRYSLRSVHANVPHRRIIVAGGKPSWLRSGNGLLHLPREQHAAKWHNSTQNVIHAISTLAETEEPISSPFLLFNDDFYVLQPIARMPVYHLGRLNDLIETYRKNRHTGAYWRGMLDTHVLLKQLGIGDPLAYGLHLPLPIYPAKWIEAYGKGKHIQALHMRTLYGNLAKLKGTERKDVKVHQRPRDQWPEDFLSSNDDIHLNGMKAMLETLFPEATVHEQ